MSVAYRCFRLLVLTVLLTGGRGIASPQDWLDYGWRELHLDHEQRALNDFGKALQEAVETQDKASEAKALLYLGIGSYGASQQRGLDYAARSFELYARLGERQPALATEGRARCLQLIATIYARQGRLRESIVLSRAVLQLLPAGDSTGTRGLALTSLGRIHMRTGEADSAVQKYRLALKEYLATRQLSYLPSIYIELAGLDLSRGRSDSARIYYDAAARLAARTGNRQAQVLALIGISRWLEVKGAIREAEDSVKHALVIAESLQDRSFSLQVLNRLQALYLTRRNYGMIWQIEERRRRVQDSVIDAERRDLLSVLEVQYRLSQTEAALRTSRQLHHISRFTNTLLWMMLGVVILATGVIIYYMKRAARKDHLLLLRSRESQQWEAALRSSQEAEHRAESLRMRADLEHRESQLSALTLQMVQKNELLQELRQQLDLRQGPGDPALTRIINKGMNQEKDWENFNTGFENLNAHFYSRLKESCRDISPNDLRICALIKMNLSSKEMATILGISPDSVKTARYRLRKKLGLQTEDNLTDYILRL